MPWDGTCGLTNLPIFEGEEIYVFPVKDLIKSDYISHCGTNAFYKSTLIPFEATYNEYGAGENCKGFGLPFLMSKLETDPTTFFELIHDHKFFITDGWSKEKLRVHFAMIRKDIVDRMWTEWQFDIYVGKGNASDPLEHYERNMSYARLAEQIPDYVDECFKEFFGFKSNGERQSNMTDKTWEFLSSEKYRSIIAPCFPNDSENLAHRYLRKMTIFTEYWNLLDLTGVVRKYLIANDSKGLEDFLTLCLKGIMVDNMMESVRKVWMPVTNVGSSSEGYSEYVLLTSLCDDVIIERETRYKDEEDE